MFYYKITFFTTKCYIFKILPKIAIVKVQKCRMANIRFIQALIIVIYFLFLH